MKLMKRRMLAAVFSASILLTQTVPALAQTENETISQNYTAVEEETLINPMYEGLISESMLEKPAAKPFTLKAEAGAEYTEDVNTAGRTLRKQMVERTKEIVIYFAAPEYSRDLLSSIIEAAFEHTGNSREGDYLRWHYAGAKTSTSYYDQNNLKYMTITFTFTYHSDAAQEAAVDAKLTEVYEELGLDEMDDTYEEVYAIYDYVCSNVEYDYEHVNNESYSLQYTAYGALKDGKAVCQGYAGLMYRMLLDQGIDNRFIAGTGSNEKHGWNIVKIGDVYYNLDSTWDNGKEEYIYLLKSQNNFTDHVRYDSYNSNDFNRLYPMSKTDYEADQGSIITGSVKAKYNTDARLKLSGSGKLDGSTAAAIKNPEKVTRLVLGKGISEFSAEGLEPFTSLKYLELGQDVTKAAYSDLYLNNQLIKITVHRKSSRYAARDGILYNSDFSSLLASPAGNRSSVTAADTVLEVEDNAFRNSQAASVYLPKSLKLVGHTAFAEMKTGASISFTTDAPVMNTDVFKNSKLTVYYPDYKESWKDIAGNVVYGDEITWKRLDSPFKDVNNPSIWYYSYILEANDRGIMTGTDPANGIFSPDGLVTRGMVATILYRIAGSPETKFTAYFDDVTNSSAYYAIPVTWAKENEIISGYTGSQKGKFGPNDLISREQLAVMLYRFANSQGADVSARGDLSKFTDGTQVSDYALEAISWLVGAGYLTGKDNGTRLDARGSAQRSEISKLALLTDNHIH